MAGAVPFAATVARMGDFRVPRRCDSVPHSGFVLPHSAPQDRVKKPGRVVSNVVSIDSGSHRRKVLERRDALVSAHLELVHKIAAQIHRRLARPCFELDDLISVGYVGLLQAATVYRPSEHGHPPFDAFARLRIRGAILDSVRRRHWVENMSASVEEIPLRSQPATAPGFETSLDRKRELERMYAAIDLLPDRLRRLLRLYYGMKQPTLRTLAVEFGVGEARASHLHRRALRLLKIDLTRKAA